MAKRSDITKNKLENVQRSSLLGTTSLMFHFRVRAIKRKNAGERGALFCRVDHQKATRTLLRFLTSQIKQENEEGVKLQKMGRKI